MKKKEKESDRRVGRTQQLLQDALVELIIEKGYEGITVQDIIDRANVGRSTFYAHYFDKEDLLLSGLEKLHEELDTQRTLSLSNQGNPEGEMVELSLALFLHAQNYHRIYKAMVGKQSGELVIKKVFDSLAMPLRECLKRHYPEGSKLAIPFEISLHFLVNSLLGLLTWWLNNDLPHSAQEMSRMYQQLAVQSVIKLTHTDV